MRLPARLKVFAAFCLLLCCFGVSMLGPVAYAQDTLGPAPDVLTSTDPDVQDTYHARVQILLIELSSALICQLSGVDILNSQQGCLGIDSMTHKIGYAPQDGQASRGMIGFAFQSIGSMYTQPVSSTEFVHYLAGNFGITHPALAQQKDSGSYTSFSAVQAIFIQIRNISFFFLVILFILIGVAIMLRLKIDPRTVMSIQNQLPKIVITILLVTFSYAIAGLLTDGMWLLTYTGINLLGEVAQSECTQTNPKNTFQTVGTANLLNNPMAYTRDLFSDAGCFGAWDGLSGLSTTVGFSMGDVLTGTIFEAIGLDADKLNGDCHVTVHMKWGFLPTGVGGLGNCAEVYIYRFVSWLIGIVAILVVLIAMLIALVRLWFTLIKAYVYILLDVITAPLQIIMGLMPGGSFGFQHWLRHILAYLLLYPATAAALMTAVIFALAPGINNNGADLSKNFIPPFVGNPLITENLGALIAFGIILVTPELLEMIKDALKVKNSARATAAIVSGVGRGISVSRPIGSMAAAPFKGHDGHMSPARWAGGQVATWAKGTGPGKWTSGKVTDAKKWRQGRRDNAAQRKKDYEFYRSTTNPLVKEAVKPALWQRAIQAPRYDLKRAGNFATKPAGPTIRGHKIPVNPLYGTRKLGSATGHALSPKTVYGFFRKTRESYLNDMEHGKGQVQQRSQAVAERAYREAKHDTSPFTARDIAEIKEYLRKMGDHMTNFETLPAQMQHEVRAQVKAGQAAGEYYRRFRPHDESGTRKAERAGFWDAMTRRERDHET